VNPNAACVVDDLVTDPTWTPCGVTVTVKGPVQIHESGGEELGPGFGPRWIELAPHWVSSWGIDADPFAAPTPPRRVRRRPLRRSHGLRYAQWHQGCPSANGRLMRWLNKWASKRIRKSGKFMGGMNALVLTTVGRKSGVEHSTPVGWFLGEDGEWLIVASAAGAARNPAWYYNIAAHPDKVRIELSGREVDVVATQLHGAAREPAWRQITTAAPRFAQYQEKTDRQLPRCRKPPSIDTSTLNTTSG
jgi:deazaflavin-dependent oxidoreductase (nitroreductase family)